MKRIYGPIKKKKKKKNKDNLENFETLHKMLVSNNLNIQTRTNP